MITRLNQSTKSADWDVSWNLFSPLELTGNYIEINKKKKKKKKKKKEKKKKKSHT